jgi:hypothetical protein
MCKNGKREAFQNFIKKIDREAVVSSGVVG